MLGLMQDRPLMIASLLTYASENHTHSPIVSVDGAGSRTRLTYPQIEARAAKLAHALRRLGVAPGDRVGTLAWNDHRHLELYFAVSGIESVCHTINPRLFSEQIAYIINHAEDKWVFVDPGLLSGLEAIADQVSNTLTGVVVMGAKVPKTSLTERMAVLSYEELIAPEDGAIDWPSFDENTASSLCYTSGTTGNPRGALYSHRSTVLHAWSIALPDMFGLRAVDRVMPVVPMFHVNAWGLPYASTLTGAGQILPGPRMDGASLHALIRDEAVTLSAGVPTVWLSLMEHLESSGGDIPPGLRILVGGSALPQIVCETLEGRYGVQIDHGWGMTEMSPVGAINKPKPENAHLKGAERFALQRKQGRRQFGLDMRIVGDSEESLPKDGKTFGELWVRGPWVASAYYEAPEEADRFRDGWFRTGDVCTIDESGYMHIVDRSKDVIKSGGEWISSIELENIAVGHPKIREAAVIPARHEKWGERPLLIAVPAEGTNPSKDELLACYDGKVANWMVPDDVVLVAELPHTATGKLLKRALRDEYNDYLMRG